MDRSCRQCGPYLKQRYLYGSCLYRRWKRDRSGYPWNQLLENHKDYTTVYKNNLSIGQASVTIKGKGSFFGTMIKKFWIHPEKVRSLKVKKKGKVTTISFKKNKGRVNGYKIQYSRRKDMKHSKYLIVKKNRCKIKNQCKIYVRVKAYKQIGKKKIYSLKWAKK